MFKKFSLLIILTGLSCFLSNCGSGLNEVEDSSGDLAPEWFQSTPKQDKNWFFGIGTATSASIQVALDRARANAKKQLSQSIAEQVKVKTQNTVEEFGAFTDDNYELNTLYEETAVLVSETAIVNTTLHERKMTRYKKGTRWFVCLKVRKEDVAEITRKTLRNFSNKFSNSENRKRIEKISEEALKDSFFD